MSNPTTPPSFQSLPIAIIGGGITGLAAAQRLHSRGKAFRLFEAAPRLGGVLETVERDDYLVERSADNFLIKTPHARALCEELGLGDQLVPTNADRRGAMVVCRGRLLPVPEGFVLAAPQRLVPIITSSVLSVPGRLRLACEPFIKQRTSTDDESVADFARRRLGREAYERLVQPLIGGIYAGDAERLSMLATTSQFVEQEREFGSLWRAARKKQLAEQRERGARYSAFMAPRGGMKQLIERLIATLPREAMRVGVAVQAIERGPQHWRLRGTNGGSLGEFDAVIVTTPAYHAAELVAKVDALLARELCGIEYSGTSVVCLGLHESQLKRPVSAFGIVAPAMERREAIAISFGSYKYPGRAPEGELLVRVFIGGALQPQLAERDDAELLAIAQRELSQLVGLAGEPRVMEIARWPQRMPQYNVGHLHRIARIEARVAAHPGLQLAGAAYRGVGIPQCIADGQRAAEACNDSAPRRAP